MRHVLKAFSVLIVLSLVWLHPPGGSSAFAGDTTYRDPRQPSFALLVPDGWTANKTEQGVTLTRGRSYFQLGVMSGAAQPGTMLVQFRAQFERQWKEFREVDAGRVVFGGQNGGYAVYAGVPPSGIPSFQRVVTMSNGKLTFVAFEGVTSEDAKTLTPQLERIERSFTPDPVR